MSKIKVALMYDFDKTLSPKDMQEFSFIPSLGYQNPGDFWSDVNKIKTEQKMDSILAYLYMMLKKADANSKPILKQNFVDLGKDIEYYPGVEEWFKRINEYGDKLNIEVEHYIISSGLTEIIEGTSINDEFKKVYACKYYYDANGVAKWPALVVNYTTKTQYIFRINKQVLDESEDNELNRYTKMEDRPIPFSRMIYIGDGLTDVPCMKLVKEYGGTSIAVHQKDNQKMKEINDTLVDDNRVDFSVDADYTENSLMDTIIKTTLEKIATEQKLNELK